MFTFIAYTGASAAAHVMPVYKIRKSLASLFKVPLIGGLICLAYSFGISWIVTNFFHFKSSIAGVANLLAAIGFTGWMYAISKR